MDEIRKFVLGDSYVLDLLDHTHSLLFSVRYNTAAAILLVASVNQVMVVCDFVKLLTNEAADCWMSYTYLHLGDPDFEIDISFK